MLVVSPYSRGGLVSSEVYDHTSILRFLETRFGVEVRTCSAWRRETTGDLTGAFNFAAPPTYKMPGKLKVPPLLPSEEVRDGDGCTTKDAGHGAAELGAGPGIRRRAALRAGSSGPGEHLAGPPATDAPPDVCRNRRGHPAGAPGGRHTPGRAGLNRA